MGVSTASYVGPDHEITGVAGADLVSGEVVVGPDGRIGVVTALTGYKSGQQYRATTVGRFTIKCLAAATFTAANAPIVYWDVAAQQATNVSAGNKPLGRPAKDKANGETTVDVLLNGQGPAA